MAMKEYKKSIIIEPKIDESKVNEIEQSIKEMTVKKFLSEDAQQQFEKFAKETNIINEKINLTKKALNDIKDFKSPEFTGLRKELESYLVSLEGSGTKKGKVDLGWDKFFNGMTQKAIQLGKTIYNEAKKFLEDLYDEAKEMMEELASYSETSSVYSSEATNLKLSYGLSGSEAYAWSKAAKDVGFSSFDDYLENFMYATEETNQRLQMLVKKYEETYEHDVEVANAYQKFQESFKDFKTQLELEIINFFMDNSDLIKSTLELATVFMEDMLKLVGWIVQHLSSGRDRTEYERAASIADIYNNYGASATTNTNVKIDNTFNGVSNNDRGMLIDAGSMTYRQILEALK